MNFMLDRMAELNEARECLFFHTANNLGIDEQVVRIRY